MPDVNQGIVVRFRSLSDAELLTANAALVDRFRQLFAALRPDIFDRMILRPITSLAGMVSCLPASMAHHDNDEGGLFRHTLEVAIGAIELFDQESNYQHLTDKKVKQETERARLGTFASALLHDLGKLHQMRVTSEADPESGLTWPTGRKPLASWAASHALSHVYISWFSGRSRRDWRDHEPLGTLYYHRLFPGDWIVKVGRSSINQVIHALGKNLHAAHRSHRNPISLALEVADQRITAMALQRSKEDQYLREQAAAAAPAAPGAAAAPVGLVDVLGTIDPGSRTSHDFIWAVREMRKADQLKVNLTGGDVFIGSTHTLVVVDAPAKGVLPLPFRVAQQLGTHFAGNQMLKARYGSLTTPQQAIAFFAPEMRDRWSTGSHPTRLGVVPEIGRASASGILHVLVYRSQADAPTYERHAWIVHNRVLWGTDAPTPQTECYHGEVDLRQSDGRSPSIPPDELGFIPLAGIDREDAYGDYQRLDAPANDDPVGGSIPSDNPPRRPKTRVLTAEGLRLDTLAPTLGGSSLFPTPADSVFRIWQILNQFLPIPEASDPIYASWQFLDAQINSRNGVDEDQLDQVLHHIVGRLRPSGISWDQVGTFAQTVADAPPTRKTAYPDKKGRSDRARYLQTIEDDHIPSAKELAQRLAAVALGAARTAPRSSVVSGQWSLVVNGSLVGIRWPAGFSRLCSQQDQEAVLIFAAADVLLPDIHAHLKDVVVPGPSGIALSFVQLGKARYKSAADHDCLLIIDTSMVGEDHLGSSSTDLDLSDIVVHSSWSLIT